MKISLLIFIMFFGYALIISGQEYIPFPKDSSAWRERGVIGDSGQTIGYFHHFNFLLGDSTINNNTYTKLFQGQFPFIENSPPPYTTTFLGFLREEEKRIYYSHEGNISNEAILYDFNLEVGDTMFWDGWLIPTITYPWGKVLSIDSILLDNGEYRKQFQLSTINGTVVEGIGNINSGLLYPDGGFTLDFYTELICYSDKDSLIYSNSFIESSSDCLDITVGVEEITSESLQIYPNPIEDVLVFSRSIQRANVFLISSLGQKVFTLNNYNGNRLDMTGIKRGVYYLNVQENEQPRQIFKLLKL